MTWCSEVGRYRAADGSPNEQVTILCLLRLSQSIPYMRLSCALIDVMGTAPFCYPRSALSLFTNSDETAYSSIPDAQPISVRTCNHIVVLPIPLDLRSGVSPISQTNHSSVIVPNAQIPSFDRTIDTCCGHQIRIPRMPIDIGDGTGVGENQTREAR